ncbi:MAG: AgmX/PglI C-terminal domain-containing protein [Myxococcota bacterium]
MQGTNPGTQRPAGQAKDAAPREKLLRIGVIHDKRVVEERFIRGQGDVTFGADASNVVQLAGMGAPPTLKLFESRGPGRYTLVFEKGIDGRIDLGQAPETFAELIQSGKAKKRGNAYTVDLSDTSRGRVVVGAVVILFQFVDAPPSDRSALTQVLKGGLLYKMDWPYRYILGAVFLVMGGSGLSAHVWWIITGQYYHNPFGSEEEAYASLRVEMKPEKKKKETQTVKVEAPAIKAEPSPSADQKKAQEAAKAPGPKNGRDKAGPVSRETRRAKLAEGVRSKTFLGALGSGTGDGRPVVHDSNYAAAFDFAEGGAAAQANGGFNGGPTAAAGGDGGRYKTLNQNDVGGGRLETTTAKTEEKTADSEVKIKANVRDGSISGQEGTGKIDKDSVARVFSRRKGAIKYCYENALRVDQNLKGKVTIRFTIGPAGRITSISAAGNTTGNSAVADCIIDKVQGWRFDPPDNGSVTFSYPFLLDTK